MDLMQFLSTILQGNQQQPNMLAGNWRGADSEPNRLLQPGAPQMPQQAPQQMAPAPQAAPPAAMAPQQAPMPDQQQTAAVAPPASSGGGFLERLFGGGQSSGENQTIQWLTDQGMDPGAATIMAKHKPALQEYLLQRAQGKKPIEIAGKLVDPDTYKVLADFSGPKDAGFTLGEGQIRYDDKGNVVAKGAAKDPGAPHIETFFDAVTGQEYKGQWNPETKQFDRIGGLKTDKGGFSVVTNPDGTVSVTQGVSGRSMTEAQSKDTVFATKAAGSLPTIDKFGDALTSLPESVGGQIPVVGNYMKSAEYQQAEQAGREFLAAILRKESGAAISIPERNEYGGIYLPEPGDKPPLLAQKKQARQRALDAIKAGMPAAAILAQENALRQGAAAPADAGGNDTPPPSYTGKNWKWLTPEQRKLWQ